MTKKRPGSGAAMMRGKILANIYTTSEAAEYVGLSVWGFRYHIRQRNIVPDKRMGNGMWLWTRDTLNRFKPKKRGPWTREQTVDKWTTRVEIQILSEDRRNKRWVKEQKGRCDGIAYTYLQIMGKPTEMSWKSFTRMAYDIGAVLEKRGVVIPDESELGRYELRDPDMRQIDIKWIRANRRRLGIWEQTGE